MNAPATSSFPAARVTPNAANAFGGIWRLTVRRYYTVGHWLTLAGMLAALVVFSFPMAPNRAAAAQGFLPWAATFYVCFIVPLLSFVTAAGTMRDDLGAGSIDYIFTRPVKRPAFVGFRYLSHLALNQLNFLLGLATVIGVGIYRQVPDLWAAVPLLLLAQVVVITVFSAFGFLCGMLTSRYVIVGLIYGGIIEVGIGQVPTQLNRISMIRQAMGILQPLLPPEKAALSGILQVDPVSAPFAVAWLLTLAVVMVGATALVFRLRELLGSPGRE